MKNNLILHSLFLFFFSFSVVFSQTELTPVSNKVYDYLKRMQLKGIISNYNSSSLPLDRRTVGEFLMKIYKAKENLSSTDRSLLGDFLAEFNLETIKTDSLNYSFFNDMSLTKIFSNDRQKYLLAYSDENTKLFLDGTFTFESRRFYGDSFDNSFLSGELGIRFKGTLYNNLSFYIRLSNGQQIGGNNKDKVVASAFDPKLSSNSNFIYKSYFDTFEGYLRYTTDGEWFSLSAGREALTYGFGYSDKLFLSTNIVPFDFLKVDLKYKALSYTYFYGTIKGDSLGVPIVSKNIVSNQINVNLDKIKFGFWEAVITANSPISFSYLNPINFLISSNFSNQQKDNDNCVMGFDVEIAPLKNISFQGSLFVDDLDFSTLFTWRSMFDTRLGYQLGFMWEDFLNIDNLKFITEYTRINPYVYTHRYNPTSYTSWDLCIGDHLPPNSDEIFFKFVYDFTNRIKLSASYAFQRSANGYTVGLNGKITNNYGGDLLQGIDDYNFVPSFLSGNRYDKQTITVDLYFEPIKQYFLNLHLSKILQDNYALDKNISDNIFYFTIGVDF